MILLELSDSKCNLVLVGPEIKTECRFIIIDDDKPVYIKIGQ